MKATDLYQKMVTDPNSVDVHDVTLAAAEASMSLNLAKTVVERAVQAYRDIINMR
jgi:flagellar hook-basal body complex protein FliE